MAGDGGGNALRTPKSEFASELYNASCFALEIYNAAPAGSDEQKRYAENFGRLMDILSQEPQRHNAAMLLVSTELTRDSPLAIVCERLLPELKNVFAQPVTLNYQA